MAINEALRDELLKLEGPVFAVLDGAQFDDLPRALIDGDFVYRPLYRDRGGQARDFDLTAPQLVWLDRSFSDSGGSSAAQEASREEDVTARGDTDPNILSRLLELLEEKPAAVFWQCPEGGERLYRHLRKINRVRIAPGRLPSNGEERPQAGEDDILLFRHADANVMAQALPALPARTLLSLMGPAITIRFVPSMAWSLEDAYEFNRKPEQIEASTGGMLRFDSDIMQAIESRRSFGILRHLLITFADHHRRMGEDYRPAVVDAHRRATQYGIETFEDFELFTRTDLEYGPRFEFRPEYKEAHYMLGKSHKSPTERVYYARRACLDAAHSTA